MAREKFSLIPGLLGVLAILVGLLFYPYNRMTTDDMRVAFGKLAQIPLQSVRASESSTLVFDIPNNEHWAHILRKWGEPHYVIAIGTRQTRQVIGLGEAGIRVELLKSGEPVELKPRETPYGYSESLDDRRPQGERCCLEFRANSGDKLTLAATIVEERFQPKAGAEIFVVSDWLNTKDLIVGADLDDDLLPVCKWVIGSGCLLSLLAIALRVSVRRR